MARAIFLGLLAANLVFFGWQLVAADDRRVPTGTTPEFDVPQLSLVDQDGLISIEPTSASAAADGAGIRCLSLGPFVDDTALEAAQLKLSALGLSGSKRRAQGQVWVGYWIFLAPEESRQKAISKVEALRARGVGDLYIEPAGERENAISLGVFSERARAQRRFREIRELGFEPQIARRTRQGSVYWLDFVPENNVRIDPADFQVASGRIVRLASRVCQAPTDRIE